MKGTRRSAAIVAIRSAVSSACFSFSIAHGPPMSASGWPPPRTTLPIRIIVTGAASSPSTEGGLPEVRGGSVVAGPAWSPSTVGGLPEVRGGSVVARPAWSPSTGRGLPEVRGGSAAPDRIEAEAHRPALVGDRALLGQEVDEVVGGVGLEFRGVGAVQAADVARVLDHRALHPETDPEVRHAPLACVADRLDLALDPPVAEAAGHQDAVDVGEGRVGAHLLDVLGVHPLDVHASLVGDPAVR